MGTNLSDLPRELSLCGDVKLKMNEPLSKHCGYGVGGAADFYIEAFTVQGLITAYNIAARYKIPVLILGNGTNVLFSDQGFRGLVISTKGLTSISIEDNMLEAECGTQIGCIINLSILHGLSGLEKLAGIPATLGGAIAMNASAFGTAVSDRVLSVCVFENGKILSYSRENCAFGYRKSRFQTGNGVILSATFNLLQAESDFVRNIFRQCLSLRKSIQPQGRSCGSVFRNTSKYSAGQLIDMAGLKGASVGKAFVSEKHANFILTQDGATARNVFDLINIIKKKVFDKFDVILQEEVKFIGEF